MAHRLGNGQRVEDLEAAMAEWRAAGRSPSTYCSKRDHEAWVDDLGELTHTLPDGTEIRRHASIKCGTYRSGNPKIAHNRVIVGNPTKYAEWKRKDAEAREAEVPLAERPWMPEWTFYPDREFDDIVARYTS